LRLGRKKQERERQQTAQGAVRIVLDVLNYHARTLPESRHGHNERVHFSALLRGFQQRNHE